MATSRILRDLGAGARVTRVTDRLVLVSVPIAPATERPELDGLTKAEKAIVELASSGLSNAAIARRRRCKPRTVANQLAVVFRKLGVGSRRELAAKYGR